MVAPENIANENAINRDSLLENLMPVIQNNCHISNAQHSGLFSVCGLFLRLKDRYHWEKNLPPWHPTDREDLLQWIDGQEELWLESYDTPFEPLRIKGRSYLPLNNQPLNKLLLPFGLYYGAGYGRGLKPTFFLGTLKEERQAFGYRIIILDRDLACDLSLSPGLRQGRTIIIRLDPLRFLLWAKIQETEQLEREGTEMALAGYGWSPDQPPDDQMEAVVLSEMETILHHELGEALDRTFPKKLWRSTLGLFPFSRIELYLRTLKDLLADTHPRGTLSFIIRGEKTGALGFYLSNMRGLRRALFPEMVPAIRQFRSKGNWEEMDAVRKLGRERMMQSAQKIIELSGLFLPGRAEEFSHRFEALFFQPLGL
ncbi:MAG: Sfum_1244 family protein [Thermodesulfobacteriota bacterium]